jgi:hypothetical protein
MMAIDGRNGAVQLADHYAIAPAAGVYDDVQGLGPEPQYDEGNGDHDPGPVDGDAPAVAQQQIQIAASMPIRDSIYQLSVMAGASTPYRAYSSIRAEVSQSDHMLSISSTMHHRGIAMTLPSPSVSQQLSEIDATRPHL